MLLKGSFDDWMFFISDCEIMVVIDYGFCLVFGGCKISKSGLNIEFSECM